MVPKILVLSNECFSKMSSNGRTLGNFFKGWPKDKLAQFYISSANPDFEYCNNYFRVTDGQALSALKSGTSKGCRIKEDKGNINLIINTGKKRNRNALTMLARNFVWFSGRWKKCGFEEWVSEFRPDIVLLQAGDFAFMYDLAVKITKKFDAKLMIYNSEGFYFKNFDYFRSKGVAKLLYPLFRSQLMASLEKAYRLSKYVFYPCDELKNAYDLTFNVQSEVIYTASDIISMKDYNVNKSSFITSYCGNLGIDRHKGLIEIANILQKVSPNYYVDVYGKIPNEKVKADFDSCKGIRYKGIVSYEEVKNVMAKSDLLVHVESLDPFYQEDLKFAFSTKIADILSSGKCFLIYGSEKMASFKYLKNNDVAFTASNKTSLENVLNHLINYPEDRNRYREKALRIAKLNHDCNKNTARFQTVLKNL